MTDSKVKNLLASAADTNKKAATTAGVLATGKAANKMLVSLVGPKLPMMVRGYADHPLFKLALANAAKMAIDQFRPNNDVAQRIATGMIISAYSEFIDQFDIEGIIDTLLNDSKVLRALDREG